jgi:hypothetical protein
MFGPKREEVRRDWRKFIMKSFMVYTALIMLFVC